MTPQLVAFRLLKDESRCSVFKHSEDKFTVIVGSPPYLHIDEDLSSATNEVFYEEDPRIDWRDAAVVTSLQSAMNVLRLLES